MQVTTKHLQTIRKAYAKSSSEDLVSLYEDMANSIKPKITEAMINATRLIIDGNTAEEAAEILGVSKVAISQASVKGLNRLARYYEALGADLPKELEGDFSLPKAKPHLSTLGNAMIFFENPAQSISMDT